LKSASPAGWWSSGPTELLDEQEFVTDSGFPPGVAVYERRRKDGHRTALAFLDRIDVPPDHRRPRGQGVGLVAEARRRTCSFVDAASFQVMRDRRLREALAFGQDFATAGFVKLRP
jgi:hypothetical protein